MSSPTAPHDSRQRLLESAIIHFAARGFDGAGIRDIARGAQANPALVAYHFASKEGLYQEALREIFSRRPSPVAQLQPLPEAGDPDARHRALEGLRAYIRAVVLELMACDAASPVDEAAMILMAREMQSPRGASAALLLELVGPYVSHLTACLRILRPDLDEDGLLFMGGSIQGQLLHFRNSLGLARLIRGNPAYPEDLEALARHFITFSLRGLGVPEAFPQARS